MKNILSIGLLLASTVAMADMNLKVEMTDMNQNTQSSQLCLEDNQIVKVPCGFVEENKEVCINIKPEKTTDGQVRFQVALVLVDQDGERVLGAEERTVAWGEPATFASPDNAQACLKLTAEQVV